MRNDSDSEIVERQICPSPATNGPFASISRRSKERYHIRQRKINESSTYDRCAEPFLDMQQATAIHIEGIQQSSMDVSSV